MIEMPAVESTVLVLVDEQEKFVPVMNGFDSVLDRGRVLLQGFVALGGDVIVTEQYPQGLGSTITPILECLPLNTPIISKTSFSIFQEPMFRASLESKYRKTVVIAGIEAHICVLQSVFDALAGGYQAILVSDAVTSRKASDCERALLAAQAAGAVVVPTESILFWLMRDAKSSAFKTISRLIR